MEITFGLFSELFLRLRKLFSSSQWELFGVRKELSTFSLPVGKFRKQIITLEAEKISFEIHWGKIFLS